MAHLQPFASSREKVGDGKRERDNNVLLYIDNSNIFINAMQHSAFKKSYKNGVIDLACRIDIGKLVSRAVGRRTILSANLYGSEPPALDTVWEAIRNKKIMVETFKRSRWNNKEKQIDTAFTTKATRDCIKLKELAGTLIIFAGDVDYLPLIKDAILEDGYNVEVWSFKKSLNSDVKNEGYRYPTKLQIKYIEDIFSQVTYTTYKLRKEIPQDRSSVASISFPTGRNPDQVLREFVAKCGEIFGLPMMGKYFDEFNYIVFTPCLKEAGHNFADKSPTQNYNYNAHIVAKFEILKDCVNYCTQITTWFKFISERKALSPETIPLSTRFNLLSLDTFEDEIDFHDAQFDDDGDTDENLEVEEDKKEEEAIKENDESGEDGYMVVGRKPKKEHRLYSEMCRHHFWCKADKCSFTHTPQEKEFFNIYKDGRKRGLYKTKACTRILMSTCKYTGKSYLCPYAHNMEESRCLICKKNGLHWMDQCPQKTD